MTNDCLSSRAASRSKATQSKRMTSLHLKKYLCRQIVPLNADLDLCQPRPKPFYILSYYEN